MPSQINQHKIAIQGKFSISHKLDQTRDCEIFLGYDNQFKNQVYIKQCPLKEYRQPHLIIHQAKILLYLNNDKKSTENHVPRMLFCCTQNDFNFLITESRGPSLQSVFKQKFSLKTVIMIADQIFQRIQFIHNKNLVHRNLSPQSIYLQKNISSNHLIIADFQYAKPYIRKQTHIPHKKRPQNDNPGLFRFASISYQSRYQLCIYIDKIARRDDMESIGYILIYLLKGTLPWIRKYPIKNVNKYVWIQNKKLEISSELLCKGCPIEFEQYMEAVKSLKFEQKPNYKKYRESFKKLYQENNYKYDNIFDWQY